jgi:hypothetical protein
MNSDEGEVGAYMIQDALVEIREFIENDEWTVNSLLEFYARNFNPRENQAAQEDLFKFIDKEGDTSDPEFRLKATKGIWKWWNEKLVTLDQFTQTGAMGFGARKAATELKFAKLSPLFFMEDMQDPGSFGTISGKTREKKKGGSRKLGIGKTATALVLGKMYADARYAVATNIPFTGSPAGFVRVRTLRELVQVCIRNILGGSQTLAILDEFSQYISKEYAGKTEWVDLKKLLYLFRKFGILLFVITQRESEIPTAISEMGVVHIQKLSQERMNFRSGAEHFRIRDVPDSPIPFETFTPGMFRVDDLPIEAFYNVIFDAEKEGRPILDAALLFLSDPSIITRSERMAAAKVLYVHGRRSSNPVTEKEIGALVGVSQQAVSKWLKDMGLAEV